MNKSEFERDLELARNISIMALVWIVAIAAAVVGAKLYSTLDAAHSAINQINLQVNRSLLPVLAQDLDRMAASTENVSDAVGDLHASVVRTLIPTVIADLNGVTGSISEVAGSVDKTRTQLDRLIIITGGAVTNIEKATRDLDEQEAAQIAYLNSTAANMVKLTNDADKLVSDPELAATFKNLSVTTKNLGEVSENFSKLSDFYYRKLTAPVTLARKVGEAVGYYGALAGGAVLGKWH